MSESDYEAYIQWKGTDVCMDLHCPKCQHHNHYDGMFAYAVECANCKTIWLMNEHVKFREAKPEDGHWATHPLHSLDDAGFEP